MEVEIHKVAIREVPRGKKLIGKDFLRIQIIVEIIQRKYHGQQDADSEKVRKQTGHPHLFHARF